MNLTKLRAFWWQRQGLEGSLRGASAAAVLERSGWARSVAGAGPYLTLFARGGIGRAAADAAVAKLEIHELPAARGCTYVVPASDFALALQVGQPFRKAELATARKLGVNDKEIEKLRAAVTAAVGKKPLAPEEIREAVGSAARSLGEEGKKKGLTTTLPVALGALQAEGEIRRAPVNGRLDQQRYGYVRWHPNPLGRKRPSDEECHAALAERYFGWLGVAKLEDFTRFSGLTVKASKAAVAGLGLVEVEEGWLARAEDRETFLGFAPPKAAQYQVVSNLDALTALRDDSGILVEPEDFKKAGRDAKGGLSDRSHHPLLDRGRLVGQWEYDPEAGEIVWTAFQGKSDGLTRTVRAAEEYIQNDLGDARGFSLDSPKSRAPRLAALRAAARG